jgi:hypothetical protein
MRNSENSQKGEIYENEEKVAKSNFL